ncbi:MAG: hypothetical protein HY211_00765 [Candidatus Omnitrophica bacterium]|nr:hypothetical protein [Candidatus Omnitrophota bacterium]
MSTAPSSPNSLRPQPWRPHPGPQEFFLNLWQVCFEALFGGAKGPGKTDAIVMEATRQLDHPRYRGVIFRRTYPQLQEIMDRCHRWYSSLGGMFNSQERRWRFPSGATIFLAHCQHEDDKYNYQGHEYQFMGFDQLEQFTESQYLFLISQVRTIDPSIRCYVRATANPGGVGHAWVKRRFIEGKRPNQIYKESFTLPNGQILVLTRCFVPATIHDNPTLVKSDPRYLAWLQSLPEKERKAFLEGNWDVMEGQFFDIWNSSIHVIPTVRPPEGFQKFISLDYGYSKPASAGWWYTDYDGRMVRYREVYSERLIYSELAELILSVTDRNEQIAYCVADPSIWDDRQHHWGTIHGESGAETMQKIFGQRIRLIRGDNRRIIGWNRMRERLKPFQGQGGMWTANLLVMDSCRDFIRTLPGLIHDEHNPEDLDTSGEDHAADETRYAVMSRPQATPAPTAKSPEERETQEFWDAVRKDLSQLQHPPQDEETWEEINA